MATIANAGVLINRHHGEDHHDDQKDHKDSIVRRSVQHHGEDQHDDEKDQKD